MDRERWDRIQALFQEALERSTSERRAFVASRCAEDPELGNEVLAMLAEDAREDLVLDRGLAAMAGRVTTSEPHPATRDLGPYRLGELIGEGGMGVVYLAERADLGSRVAIKILRDAWLSPARRERFTSEQRTLAQLNHPAIARLFDADTLPDGTPWFAMEYVEGLSLTRYCAVNALSLRQRIELLRAVCEGVQHAHQQAIIHRDLKPSNILVTHEGQPKLLDFGISKQLEALDSRADRTLTELRLMTPAYAAPEQFRGEGQGVHTDVYALGVILFELLTGRLPYDLEGRTPTEAAEIVTLQEPEKPSVVARRVANRSASDHGASWPDLDVLCLTALQKDPARRYRSVEALMRDLDHYLRDEPLEARPDTIGYRTRKFVRRHWRPLAVATALVVTVVGLVTFYTVQLAAARNAAVAEAARRRRVQEFMNNLLQGDDLAGPSDSLRVVTLLERGALKGRALATEPAMQADLFQQLGGSFQTLGRLDRADSMLTAALAIREALPAEGRDIAESLIALGLLRAEQSRYEEAERLVRQALVLTQSRGRADPTTVAVATHALGRVLVARGDYQHAIETLEQAARFDSIAGLTPIERMHNLGDLASAHSNAGHFSIADSMLRAFLAVDRATLGDRHPDVAADLANLGGLQQELGHWREAEAYFREALEIYRGWFGEDHFETASMLTLLSTTLLQQDRVAEARAPLLRALAIRERVYGIDHPQVALTLDALAQLAEQEGRYQDSEAYFQREIRIQKHAYNDHHQVIAVAYANLGSLYTDWKRYDDAARCQREAIRRYSETLAAGHVNFGYAHAKLGRALLRSSHYAEAEPESRMGYEILSTQKEPQEPWLEQIRKDLVAEYTALGRPADAAPFRPVPAESTGRRATQ